MSRISLISVVGLLPCFVAPALAETGYAFTVQNDSPSAMTVYADGKSECALDPGKSCRITVQNFEAKFSYANGRSRANFMPGNLEMTDVCRIDVSGARCTDPSGNATN
jgi:hypothetical protein